MWPGPNSPDAPVRGPPQPLIAAITSRIARAALAVEEGGQPGRRDDPVRVLAQLRDLGPVHLAVQPDADPPPAADVRRPEEPTGPGRHQLVLGSGQARTPQMRQVVGVVAPR